MPTDLSFLQQWSPNHHPKAWFAVNLICAAASLALLLCLLWAVDDPLAMRPVAAALYLIYSFGTTVIWCVEIGLTAWDNTATSATGSLSWEIRIELALAVYFLVDSLQLLYEWRLLEQDPTINLVEAIFNFAGYLYVAFTCWRLYRQRHVFIDLETGCVVGSNGENYDLMGESPSKAAHSLEIPLGASFS